MYRIEQELERHFRLCPLLDSETEEDDLAFSVRQGYRGGSLLEFFSSKDPARHEQVFRLIWIPREDGASHRRRRQRRLKSNPLVHEARDFVRHAERDRMIRIDVHSEQ